MTSVAVMTDPESRPAPPQLRVAAPIADVPVGLVLAAQIVIGANLAGLLAERVSWFRDNRAIGTALEHLTLVRSASVGRLSWSPGMLGGGAEFFAVLALIGALAVCATVSIKSAMLELTAVVGTWFTVSVLAAGALGWAHGQGGPLVWIARSIWAAAAGLATASTYNQFRRRTVPRSRLVDAALIASLLSVAVAVPITIKFGFWTEKARFAFDPSLEATDSSLKALKPYLYLSGVAPVLIALGFLLVRPPLKRKVTIAFGVALLIAGSLYISNVGPRRIQIAMADAGIGVSAANANSETAQVASEAPVPPCLRWSSGTADAITIVVTGIQCTQMESRHGNTVDASENIGELSSVGPVPDAIDGMESQNIVGQLYQGVVVTVEASSVDGRLQVVGRSDSTLATVWTKSCETASAQLSVRFGGGLMTEDHAANRVRAQVFGLDDYVAIACDGTVGIYNPQTGAVY